MSGDVQLPDYDALESMTPDQIQAERAKYLTEVPAEAAEPEQPEAEMAPEPQPEPEQQQDQPPPRHVPVEELAQQRQRRKEAEQRAADLERRLAQFEGYYAAQSQQQQVAQPQEEIPDPITDPEGYARYVEWKADQRAAQVEQRLQQQYAQMQQQILLREAQVSDKQVLDAVQFIQSQEPWMIDGLNRAPNPYKAAVDYAKRLGWSDGTQQPGIAAATPGPTTNADERKRAMQQQLLAKDGGQTSYAPGIANAPAAANSPDAGMALPSEAAIANMTPDQIAEMRAKFRGA